MMLERGVSIDHVATLRQARGTNYPDPIRAALLAESAGADAITLHLREDRRHIQDRDVESLRPQLTTRMNLESAITEEMISFACRIRPHASASGVGHPCFTTQALTFFHESFERSELFFACQSALAFRKCSDVQMLGCKFVFHRGSVRESSHATSRKKKTDSGFHLGLPT